MSIRTFGARCMLKPCGCRPPVPRAAAEHGQPGNFGFQMPRVFGRRCWKMWIRLCPYCDVRGMAAARQAILEYHKSCGIQDITPEDIYICNGVSEAVSMLMSALVGTGDEVLVPSPAILFGATIPISAVASLSITAVTRKMPGIRIWRICAPRSPAAPRQFW